MKQTDIDKIEQILSDKDQAMPVEGTLRIEGGKLYMDVIGTARNQGKGAINALIHAGLNTIIDEDFGTNENLATDDHGIVRIWWKLIDVNQVWR
ncbi:MAG: hypothetical protein COA43_11255 [Robiginitomaculum sp.]|nr:MAG: hypothetical protein COA43_11255 [Robiginitomaculum sp.]